MITEPNPSESELTRLADGSLPEAERARLRASIGGSSELSDALSAQERAVAAIRAIDVPAPASLHERVDAICADASPRRRRPRPRRAALLAATALVVVAAVVVAGLAGSATGPPAVRDTARLALGTPTLPAPAEVAGHLLARSVNGVPFPYWGAEGWHSAGARTDTLDARTVVTVFYTGSGGARVGYSIVGGPPLAVRGGTLRRWGSITFRLLNQGQTDVVTWQRSGHTCVLAARSVSDDRLMALASAEGSRSVAG